MRTTQQDPAAQWEAFQRLAQPGEAHKRLEPMVGTFRAQTRFWMSPQMPPQESQGTMNTRWVLGGRFLLSEYKDSAPGSPFEGIGLIGFDNPKQRYVGMWTDSMGTMLMPISEGTADARGKVTTMHRTFDDPMSGQPKPMREVITIASRDEHTYESYVPGPDGKEYKALDVRYTRAN